MKNYTITVNGNVYDVTVEENGAGAVQTAAPVVAPKAVAPAAPKAAPAAAPVPAPVPQVKLEGVSEVEAACVMAIVSHETGIPLDQLVFKSIKAV